MLASRQSEVCERNTRVDVRAGCAHCGSERVPVVPRGIRTSMEWSGLTRIGSSPLQIHIGFVSSHAKQIEHRKLSSGKAPSQSALAFPYSTAASAPSSPNLASDLGQGYVRTNIFHDLRFRIFIIV